MKIYFNKITLIFIIIFLLVYPSLTESLDKVDNTPTKWQYMMLTSIDGNRLINISDSNLTDKLNLYGNNGWEISAIIPDFRIREGGYTNYGIILKRKRRNLISIPFSPGTKTDTTRKYIIN